MTPRTRTRLFLGLLVAFVVWIGVLGEYSVLQRVQWHLELRAVQADNQRLLLEIDELEAALDEGLNDAEVERIAREQYGLQRPGETVYQLPPP
ncbi:MAG: septum formation initiator family protein [Bacteroidota bacterium]